MANKAYRVSRLGLIAAVAASLVLLYVGAQILVVDRALMPIGSSRLSLSVMNVKVVGFIHWAEVSSWR